MKLLFAWILALGLMVLTSAAVWGAEKNQVLVALDAEFGRGTSTADDAIKQGILIAIDEINSSGGVLGGRKLALIETDNRSIPARGIENTRKIAENPEVVALFCGRFSTVVIETIETVHKYGIPLLDPWAASDKIVDNGRKPNYVFRLSLKDSWAVPEMLSYAKQRGFKDIGILVPNVAWGRGNFELLNKMAPGLGLKIKAAQWFNYGDKSLIDKYLALRKSGADAIVIVTPETEGALLIKEIAALPVKERLPLISHWSITGSDFPSMTGPALQKVDMAIVQTYSFIGASGKKVQPVLNAANRMFGKKSVAEIISPVGLAHAYDLTHLLARAINKAGSTDRRAVRDSLEQLGTYEGLIKTYVRPFSPTRHEALSREDVFMVRYASDGTLQRIRQ
jgi:branched-chain amino acid transport system substrate-binding protein